jgi:cobalt-zinc-cadmium efflux system membrane fusion protein
MKPVFSLLAAALALAGCGSGPTLDSSAAQKTVDNSGGAEVTASDAKGITTQVASASSIPEYLDLPAHIEPDPTRVVHVFAPVGGRIVEMKVRPWDRVEKGQTLASLESSDLARAVADYHKALVDNQVKQKALSRAQDLLQHRAIAEKELEQAQDDAQQAQAEVEAAREQVQVFGMDPDHASTQLVVKAPRAGSVLDVGAAPGEFSQALSAPAPLATVADLSTVWALGDIYEQDFAAAKLGETSEVTLNAYPGQKWSGRVSVVSGAVDPNTRTFRLRVVLPNPDAKIKPQMFGSIRILKSTSTGVLVPAASVVREGNDAYMFVAKANGHFERRTVTIGRTVNGLLEVTAGVKQGETIVTDGSLFLRSAGKE